MTTPEVPQSVTETVRTHDPDRYLSALMAPRRVRSSLMALYAFNAELARIPNLVSEPALGEIRLQWWRDVLGSVEDETRMASPLAGALSKAITKHELPKPRLIGMIDARSADLDGGGFADLQALKAYLYKSEGAVFSLSVRILGVANAASDNAANSAAVAYGLANLLRTLPHDASAGRVMLPLSQLDAHGIQVEELLAGMGADSLKPIMSELSDEARAACKIAYKHILALERVARRAFSPLALVEPYLKSLEQPGHRPLQDVADINPLMRFWRLWRAS